MLTLAIDTATHAQTIALTLGVTVIARRMQIGKPNHAESLLHNVNAILQQADKSVFDLELICVGLGPGSFTGVRVGVSTGKALALAAGCPVVGVSTLAAIARPVLSVASGPVIASIDARRGEIYCGVFDMHDGKFVRLEEDTALATDAFLPIFEKHKPTVVVGNALHRVAGFADTVTEAEILALPQPWDGPSSPSVSFLGQEVFEREGGADLSELEPNYVRLSDAEIAAAGRVP